MDGQAVRMQEQRYWKPAVTVRTANTEILYHLHTADGQEYQQNSLHLLNTKESQIESSDVAARHAGAELCATPTNSRSHNDTVHKPNHTDGLPKCTTYRTRHG